MFGTKQSEQVISVQYPVVASPTESVRLHPGSRTLLNMEVIKTAGCGPVQITRKSVSSVLSDVNSGGRCSTFSPGTAQTPAA